MAPAAAATARSATSFLTDIGVATWAAITEHRSNSIWPACTSTKWPTATRCPTAGSSTTRPAPAPFHDRRTSSSRAPAIGPTGPSRSFKKDNIPFEGGDAWLYIANGQAQFVVGAPVTGAPVPISHSADQPSPHPAWRDRGRRPLRLRRQRHEYVDLVRPRRHSSRQFLDEQQPESSNTARDPDFWTSNLYPYPGQPIELHVQGQRVTLLTEAMPYDVPLRLLNTASS